MSLRFNKARPLFGSSAPCRLRWPRPRWSFARVRARTRSTISVAMLPLASTRTQTKSCAIIAALGETCGLGSVRASPRLRTPETGRHRVDHQTVKARVVMVHSDRTTRCRGRGPARVPGGLYPGDRCSLLVGQPDGTRRGLGAGLWALSLVAGFEVNPRVGTTTRPVRPPADAYSGMEESPRIPGIGP